MTTSIKTAIVGAGSVGSTIGRRLLSAVPNRFAVKYGTHLIIMCSSAWGEGTGGMSRRTAGPDDWVAAGPPNVYAGAAGTRDPSSDKVKALLEQQPGASAASVAAAVDWAEVVILAVPSWDPAHATDQIEPVLASLGPGIKGKVLIDLINGLSGWPSLSLT